MDAPRAPSSLQRPPEIFFPLQRSLETLPMSSNMSQIALGEKSDSTFALTRIASVRLIIFVVFCSFCIYRYVLKAAKHRVRLKLSQIHLHLLIMVLRPTLNLAEGMAASRQHMCLRTNGHLHWMWLSEGSGPDARRDCFTFSRSILKN